MLRLSFSDRFAKLSGARIEESATFITFPETFNLASKDPLVERHLFEAQPRRWHRPPWRR